MCVPDSWYKYSFDLFCFERWVVLEPLVCFATMAFGAYITQQGIYRQICGQTLRHMCNQVYQGNIIQAKYFLFTSTF